MHHWIRRIQFPIQCAAAGTMHVSQSAMFHKIIVYMKTTQSPPNHWWEHMHNVTLSGVTLLNFISLPLSLF